jgi:methyl-accepting chemotaxis protein
MQTELLDDRSTRQKPPGSESDVTSADAGSASAGAVSRLRLMLRRRRYWINWRSQLPATTMSLLATLFFVVMFNWAMFERTSERRAVIAEVRPLVEQRLLEQDQSFHSFLLFLSAAFIVCLVAGMVVFTHRSAGPVHRVRAHIRRATEGDLNCDVSLRKKDHFKELADEFNEMLRTWRERNEQDAEKLEALADRLRAPSAETEAVADVLVRMARDKVPVKNG